VNFYASLSKVLKQLDSLRLSLVTPFQKSPKINIFITLFLFVSDKLTTQLMRCSHPLLLFITSGIFISRALFR